MWKLSIPFPRPQALSMTLSIVQIAEFEGFKQNKLQKTFFKVYFSSSNFNTCISNLSPTSMLIAKQCGRVDNYGGIIGIQPVQTLPKTLSPTETSQVHVPTIHTRLHRFGYIINSYCVNGDLRLPTPCKIVGYSLCSLLIRWENS